VLKRDIKLQLTNLLALHWCAGVQPLTVDDDDDLASVLFTSSSEDEAADDNDDEDNDDDDDEDDDVICTDDSPVKRKSTRSRTGTQPVCGFVLQCCLFLSELGWYWSRRTGIRGSLVVDEERMRPGHWWELVLYVNFSGLMLMVG